MTKEEIAMIRTALREHGETELKTARSRKYAGHTWRKTREEMREDARVWFRLADQPDEYFRGDGTAEVNLVIEASTRGKPWITWDFVPQSEMIAKHEWRKRLPGAGHRTETRFRLVRRTAVITDEVLDIDEVPDTEGE